MRGEGMSTTVDALRALYVAKGGALTDSYVDIAAGVKVGNITTVPDLILAIAKLESKS